MPVVLEFILERVTNIAMGTEVDSVNEFEEILCLDPSLSIRKARTCGPPRRRPSWSMLSPRSGEHSLF